VDPLAKKPALAFAYHMPPRNSQDYYAMGLLDQILAEGDDSLLRQELVKRKGYTDSLNAGINMPGNMFNYQGPMLWTVSLFHDNNVTPDQVMQATESVIEQVRTKPVDQATLQRAMVKLRSDLYDNIEQFSGFGRADLLCSFALFDDDPGRINHLEEQFAKITPQSIQKTAQQYLRPENRTVLVVETKAQAPEPKSGN